MSNLLDTIKKHKILTLIIVTLIIVSIVLLVNKTKKADKIYQSGLTDIENVSFIEQQYAENEYKIVSVNEADMVNYYYKDFLDKYLNKPKEAWNLLTNDTKNNTFKDNYDLFLTYRKGHTDIYSKNSVVSKYRYQKAPNKNTIILEDSEKNIYTFYEYGVWLYEVEIKY